MTIKYVVNNCFGGFGLSDIAIQRYKELKNINPAIKIYEHNIERDDPALVQVIEEMGEKANGRLAELKIVELNIDYTINDYDGVEQILIIPPNNIIGYMVAIGDDE